MQMFSRRRLVKSIQITEHYSHGLINSLSNESYLTIPIALSNLFGRSQDYGWSHAEPIDVSGPRKSTCAFEGAFHSHGETFVGRRSDSLTRYWVSNATERNKRLTHQKNRSGP